MAETCEVVALGREDVFFEPKNLLTAYDALLLDEMASALDEQIGYGDARAAMQPYLKALRTLVPLAASSDYNAMLLSVTARNDPSDYMAAAASGDPQQLVRAKQLRKAAAALAAASKARDASPAARAVISAVSGLVEVADA